MGGQMENFSNKVVLIHGYNKSKSDMKFLGIELTKFGYEVFYANLPLRFQTVENAEDIFEKQMDEVYSKLGSLEKVHLIGHSTGGLVIRQYLEKGIENRSRIARVVMIATPNHGITLADKADSSKKKILAMFTQLFKTVKSLKTDTALAQKVKYEFEIEAGALAGNRCNLPLGKYEEGVNDGLVSIYSVYMVGLSDFKVLPYGHKDIHYKMRTVTLVDNFLKNGKFDK